MAMHARRHALTCTHAYTGIGTGTCIPMHLLACAGDDWDPGAYLRGSVDGAELSVAPATMTEMQDMVVRTHGFIDN